jgi:nicotinate phosphoribosyltransferase
VPLLAIVNEVYFDVLSMGSTIPSTTGNLKLQQKIDLVKEYNGKHGQRFKFADFGTRRRFAGLWQDIIVQRLIKELPDNFIGTSNVYLAMKYGVRPIGTMSHQWIMCGQGLPNVRISESQRYMLDAWVKEYRGDLGIALSDTLGFDAFLRDFDPFFAKLYDGCRHDSGDPFTWGEKLIAHYRKLKIDPKTKSAVFSDGLTFPLALDLCSEFWGRIQTSFGIGTNLTNDCSYDPLQIVIKLTKVNGHPVAKVSDSAGKGMCEDESYLKYLKTVFKIG